MSQKIIKLNDALDLMDKQQAGKKVPFQIVFVAYDEARNIGGHFKELSNVVRCGTKNADENATIGIQPADGSGHIITVHTWLITEFNHMTVVP